MIRGRPLRLGRKGGPRPEASSQSLLVGRDAEAASSQNRSTRTSGRRCVGHEGRPRRTGPPRCGGATSCTSRRRDLHPGAPAGADSRPRCALHAVPREPRCPRRDRPGRGRRGSVDLNVEAGENPRPPARGRAGASGRAPRRRRRRCRGRRGREEVGRSRGSTAGRGAAAGEASRRPRRPRRRRRVGRFADARSESEGRGRMREGAPGGAAGTGAAAGATELSRARAPPRRRRRRRASRDLRMRFLDASTPERSPRRPPRGPGRAAQVGGRSPAERLEANPPVSTSTPIRLERSSRSSGSRRGPRRDRRPAARILGHVELARISPTTSSRSPQESRAQRAAVLVTKWNVGCVRMESGQQASRGRPAGTKRDITAQREVERRLRRGSGRGEGLRVDDPDDVSGLER